MIWDENPVEDHVLGYILHWSNFSEEYIYFIDVKNVMEFTIRDLQKEIKYFFAVTAYNEFGESGYSNEVSTVLY